jgi:hypothetical protein
VNEPIENVASEHANDSYNDIPSSLLHSEAGRGSRT